MLSERRTFAPRRERCFLIVFLNLTTDRYDIALQYKSCPQAEAKINDRGHRRHTARVASSKAERDHLGAHAHNGTDGRGSIPAFCSSSRYPCSCSAPSSMRVLVSVSYDETSRDHPLASLRRSDSTTTFLPCLGWMNVQNRGVFPDMGSAIQRDRTGSWRYLFRVPLSTSSSVAYASQSPSIGYREHLHSQLRPGPSGHCYSRSRRRCREA